MIILTKELKNKQCTYRLRFCGDRKSLKSKSSLCIYRDVEFLICKPTTVTKQTTTKQQQNTPTPPSTNQPTPQFCSSGVRLCKSLRCSKHHHHKLNIYGCQTLFRFYKLLVSLFDPNFLLICKHLYAKLSLHSVDWKMKNGTRRWDKLDVNVLGIHHPSDTFLHCSVTFSWSTFVNITKKALLLILTVILNQLV